MPSVDIFKTHFNYYKVERASTKEDHIRPFPSCVRVILVYNYYMPECDNNNGSVTDSEVIVPS
jgi:hypothetical protein